MTTIGELRDRYVRLEDEGRIYALMALLYVVGFILLDWVSFIHPFGPFGIKPWDPPTGLTLALLVRFGLRYAVIIPIAVLLSDVLVRGIPFSSPPIFLTAAIVTAVHLAAAAALRQAIEIDPTLNRLNDLLRFVFVSLIATLALAVAVVLQFIAADILAAEDFWAASLRSWVGDFIGILALAPVLLVYSDRRSWAQWAEAPWRQFRVTLEFLAQAAGIAATVWAIFAIGGADAFKYFYVLFLPIMWVAVRHGLEGASLGILLTQVSLILAIQVKGHGPSTLIEFQMVMLALCMTGLFVGAIVSERREANRALRENEARLAAILDTAPDAILTVDDRGLIESVNPAVERMFGSAEADLLRRPITTLLPGLSLTDSDGVLHDMRGMRADGLSFPAEVAVGGADVDRRPLFIAVARDITRRVEAEAWVHKHQLELAHADRVSMVGAMASAIAHEESQPLAAIAAYTRACLLHLRAPQVDLAKVGNSLEKVAAQAVRAGEILNRLREFLQRGEMHLVPTNPAEIVNAVAELGRTDATVNGVRLMVNLPEPLPEVLADRVHIEQVILNLVRNAVDALAERPKGERLVVISARAREGRVDITVSDTGPGVDPAIAERLFNPFVTTKGSGMGLGLSISRTIVEAHGGSLVYVPAEGITGAIFTFDLPLADEQRF